MINDGYESTSESNIAECFGNNVSTQTNQSPTTICSWQIQRISKEISPNLAHREELQNYISLLPDGSEVFVLENHSVGFNVATQTFDEEIFRCSQYEIREIITSWRVLTILIPSFLDLLIFSLNQLLDAIVCSDLCQEDTWWCGISIFFLVGPSLLLSVYAYTQMGRRLLWSIRAWAWTDHRQERLRTLASELWSKANLENESTTLKMFQSLCESVPQLSLQSYVLLRKISAGGKENLSTVLWLSTFVNLISASSGLALSQSNNMFESIAGSVAIFTSLGSRAMICGGIGTISSSLWVVPISASFVIGLVTKISESVESTLHGHLHKLHKYGFEAFMMASALPPFEASGFFSSCVYVLAAIIFLVQNPTNLINIICIIYASVGQTIWVCVGFCLLKQPANPD